MAAVCLRVATLSSLPLGQVEEPQRHESSSADTNLGDDQRARWAAEEVLN